jgi:hypothetical protein
VSGKKNLIMGYWSRLPFKALEKFIASLRNTGFRGDVCIFVENVTQETIADLQAHDVIVEHAALSGRSYMTALSSRFFNYLDFLARRGDEYDNVMLTDLRDVVFQSDPFATPLPADIVFARERCLVGDPTPTRGWITDAYGAAVAHNMRDCSVSCAGTTFGTTFGILRYLLAMTRELSSRSAPIEGGVDQGVHNYIVHMRPLRNAWLDPTDSLVATMHFVPEESVKTTSDGILIDGRMVPVVHQWDRQKTTMDYLWRAPQYRLDTTRQTAEATRANPTIATEPGIGQRTGANAVLAVHHRPRDGGWLEHFLGSLRCSGYAGAVHCLGEFAPEELALLSQHGCVAHPIAAADPGLDIENIAHLYMSRVLDELAADPATQPDQVLVLDTVKASFLRDPFQASTIGLSVFCEGQARIGESDYNRHRLGSFAALEGDVLLRPVISSMLLRGRLDIVRSFYRKLFIEFIGRAELLRTSKMIQGPINKLCHQGGLGFPVIVHPNGSETFFNFWGTNMDLEMNGGVRVGGATPAIVLTDSLDSELVQSMRRYLGLPTVTT